jgi:TDG/mug DNA glycosylase family protein
MDVLEDLLRPGLLVIFCGTAAGNMSAKVGFPYANPSNRFWQILRDMKLTPSLVKPDEYRSIAEHGIGITDLAKMTSGMDSKLLASDFSVSQFKKKIAANRPQVLAFNGKKAASIYLRKPTRDLSYGRYTQDDEALCIWILPSTSSAAKRYWDEAPWRELAKIIRREVGSQSK